MLVRVNSGDIAASIHVRQIHERVVCDAVALGEGHGQCAFVEIGCSCVEIGCRSVGNRSERQIVAALRRPAAPKTSPQFAIPESLICVQDAPPFRLCQIPSSLSFASTYQTYISPSPDVLNRFGTTAISAR